MELNNLLLQAWEETENIHRPEEVATDSSTKCWTNEAIIHLISTCKVFKVDKVEVGKRDKWSDVASEMERQGCRFTKKQLRDKWCHEKLKYRKFLGLLSFFSDFFICLLIY